MSPGFLRSLPIILDSADKCHLPHHPGTCGSKPMKKSLGSQMKMSRVKPSRYGRMKCKFNWRKKKNQDDSILYSGAAKFWGSFFVTPHILNPP